MGSGALYRKPLAALSVAAPGRGGDVRAALERVLTALDCDVTHHSVPIHPADLVDHELRDRVIVGRLLCVVEALARRAHGHSGGADPAISAVGDT